MYIPYGAEERVALEGLASRLDGKAATYQEAAESVREQLRRGTPVYSLDFSALPEPRPHCYLCAFSFCRICSLGLPYGSVCSHYLHNGRAPARGSVSRQEFLDRWAAQRRGGEEEPCV